MVLVVVRAQVLPPDGDLPEHFVLLEVAVAVEDVDGNVAEIAGHLELELLAEERTVTEIGCECNRMKTVFGVTSAFGTLLKCGKSPLGPD